MARNHNGQMALYEVLNKERFNAAQKKELARAGHAKNERSQPVIIPPAKASEPKQTVWTKKPSMFGFSGGRVETYVPYPIAVTIVMALALLLIIAFQFGQYLGRHNTTAKADEKSSEAVVNLTDTAKAAKEMAKMAAPTAKRSAPPVTPAATATERTIGEPAKASGAAGGEYVIVLKELAGSRDLEPAKKYFDEHGIQTEIKNVKGSYFLVTSQRYDSLSPGTAGHAASEKIKQVGAGYKPPEGYNGFAPHMFNDVYGRKM